MIGFVGLGKMGAPMVRRLAAAGQQVTVYDIHPPAMRALDGLDGVRHASCLAEVAAGAEAVITMLPDGEAVRSAVLGADPSGDSIVAGASRGTLLIDMGSSAPWETRDLGARLERLGHTLVDAPVSGGVARARTGDLAVFVGCGRGDLDRVLSLLRPLGSHFFHTGGLGSGHATKALNNLLSAACFSATIEVVRVAEAWGLDPAVFAEVLNASTGRNNTTENKLRQFVLSGSYDSGFALALMVKDLRNAAALAGRVGLEVPLSEQVVASWAAAQAALGAGADHTEVARLIGTAPARPAGAEGARP